MEWKILKIHAPENEKTEHESQRLYMKAGRESKGPSCDPGKRRKPYFKRMKVSKISNG